MNPQRELVVAADIGTSKTRAIIGSIGEDNKIKVLAFSETPTKGVRNGVVINVDEVAESVRYVMSILERSTSLRIKKIYAGISGQKVTSKVLSCYRITGNNEVTQSLVADMENEVRHMAVSDGGKVYHIIAQEFTVDGEREIMNPVGMAGRRIDATYSCIVASENYEQNLERAIHKAGFELAGSFVNPFVQGVSFLYRDEKEAGVILIDFGAGTTGVSLYYENKLRLSFELPFGGAVITNDIREGCNILNRHAEVVKVQCGYAMADLAPANKYAQIPEVDGWPGKEISLKNLAGIIQARLEEIMEGICYRLESTGFLQKLGAGVVITGGGASLKGIDKLVSQMTGLDVRIGKPVVPMEEQLFNNQLMTPEQANLLGLLLFGLSDHRSKRYPEGLVELPEKKVESTVRPQPQGKKKGKNVLSSIFDKVNKEISLLLDENESEK